MSETITTAASSAPSTGSSGGQTSTSTPSGAQTVGGTAQGQSSAKEQGAGGITTGVASQGVSAGGVEQAQAPRVLGDTDMDALVKVKVNGKEQTMPLRDAIKSFQLEQASRQKMNEAQRAHQEAQKLVELAKTNPELFFKDVLKLDPKSWAEERLAREYEIQQMSPEARKAMELEQEVQRFKALDQKAKEPLINELKQYMDKLPDGVENATKEQIEGFLNHKRAEFQAGQQNLHQELIGAWEAEGLPKEKDFGVWMAQEMIAHKKRTGEDLDAKSAAVKVKNRFMKSAQSLFSKMDAKAIQDLLGKEIVEKLRAYDIERVSNQQAPPWAPNGPQTPAPQETGKKYMNEREWRNWINS
jgi:hypothetical protein